MERRPPAVARVIERVTRTARAHDLFAPGDLVLLWVSGGADSLCLLETLVRLRRLFRIRLAVFHLDHGLRPGSAADAAYVRRRAAHHGLEYQGATPSAPPTKGASIERWARDERRRGAAEIAERIGANRHALGHTMDDRAETVLLALVRGWGLDGLTGIEPIAGDLVRPLLDVRREETTACCRSLRLRPRIDATNADTTFLRNALRHNALPALARATDRDVVPTIARTAELLRADARLLDELATGFAAAIVTQAAEGVRLDAAGLADLTTPMASRVVRRALADAGFTWTEKAIEGILDLAAGRPGRRLALPDGARASRDRAQVLVQR
ncbi:MAG: tRNA lysidine(34) synthetase TilS [Actinomycetota bacterium]